MRIDPSSITPLRGRFDELSLELQNQLNVSPIIADKLTEICIASSDDLLQIDFCDEPTYSFGGKNSPYFVDAKKILNALIAVTICEGIFGDSATSWENKISNAPTFFLYQLTKILISGVVKLKDCQFCVSQKCFLMSKESESIEPDAVFQTYFKHGKNEPNQCDFYDSFDSNFLRVSACKCLAHDKTTCKMNKTNFDETIDELCYIGLLHKSTGNYRLIKF